MVEAAQGTIDEEHGEAVYRGPRQELGTRATLGRQDARLDEPVQGGAKKLEGG
jgi:hypothetical protein